MHTARYFPLTIILYYNYTGTYSSQGLHGQIVECSGRYNNKPARMKLSALTIILCSSDDSCFYFTQSCKYNSDTMEYQQSHTARMHTG